MNQLTMDGLSDEYKCTKTMFKLHSAFIIYVANSFRVSFSPRGQDVENCECKQIILSLFLHSTPFPHQRTKLWKLSEDAQRMLPQRDPLAWECKGHAVILISLVWPWGPKWPQNVNVHVFFYFSSRILRMWIMTSCCHPRILQSSKETETWVWTNIKF